MKLNLYAFSIATTFSLACAVHAQPDEDAAAKIEPGQQVQVEMQNIAKPEKQKIDGIYPVSSKGLINFPFIGSVKVDGMTIEEAQNTIEQTYKDAKIYEMPVVKLEIAKR
ncbi:polysaccharide biosynthesis/export family protein [Luteolibacter sp. AS25]|uniref:polysaccharide biosynthesis/export family protein n=1 Tax=Luteolibacter sp. AS25 TaxID=3135776 RepID=UPI00398AFF33